MTTFPTRREQRKHEIARDYRVRSVIDVAGLPDEVQGIADALLQNVLEIAAKSVELDTLPISEESELYLV